jgi:hypothetical protein
MIALTSNTTKICDVSRTTIYTANSPTIYARVYELDFHCIYCQQLLLVEFALYTQPCKATRTDWYVHFASLFYIIIYCYSLIYFIFRDDTYVISSVFTYLMIIWGFDAGVRILLEKDRQDTIFWKIRKILEKYQKIIFYQKTPEARRRSREEPEGSLTHRRRGPLAVTALCEGTLAHSRSRPFAYFIAPKT